VILILRDEHIIVSSSRLYQNFPVATPLVRFCHMGRASLPSIPSTSLLFIFLDEEVNSFFLSILVVVGYSSKNKIYVNDGLFQNNTISFEATWGRTGV
jgi:hypothetical protein